MTRYLRYWLITALTLLATAMVFAGGPWMWASLLFVVTVITAGDGALGDDTDERPYAHPWLVDLPLYLALPTLAALSVAWLWHLAPGDLLGLAALTHRDAAALHASERWWHLAGGGLTVGLLYGGVGTVAAHELVHRTWSPVALTLGRWLLAFTSDASFSIEHVYGHHRHVATAADPATSRRGESVYSFVLRSAVGGWRNAWRIERDRLSRLGHPTLSWRNRALRGWAMSAVIAALFGLAAGPLGAAAFVLVSLYGKCWLELVNYVEHYGLVRVAGAPVEPRHSWNCTRRVSTYLLMNLTRHSHHHAQGEVPFYALRANSDAPVLPAGYLSMALLALAPPLWHRVMTPRVLAWDRRWSSPAERALIDEANRRSGLDAFTREAPAPAHAAAV
ncbi:MAG: alkane 1-monooxygenase [Polyangiales bacterium]